MDFFSYIISNTKFYDFRFFVLISFLLQSLVLIAAPFRKKTSNRELLCVIWVGYLISDWASNFAVGLVPPPAHNQNDIRSDIFMLWSPFLLLHIGGADSIAALSATDNELWSRLAIQLGTMIFAIANAFYRSFEESKLKVPVMLMFVAGFSRYLERIVCHSQARFSSLKESLLQERQKADVSSKKKLDLDESDQEEPNNSSHDLSNVKILRHASGLFESFKFIFVDLHVDSDDRRKSRAYFLSRNAAEAFRVVEMELNFCYDLFYTKFPLIRHGLGRFLHPTCMICEAIALVLWIQIEKSHRKDVLAYDEKEIKIDVLATYALLVGALARDCISLLMLAFSDWTLASVARMSSVGSNLVNGWLSLRKRKWDQYSSSKQAPLFVALSRVLFRRWSESIPRLNLILEIFVLSGYQRYRSEQHEKALQEFGVDFLLNKLRRVPRNWFTMELGNYIFLELKDMSLHRDVEEGRGATSRGQRALENCSPQVQELVHLANTWITQKTFDESLLLWHIATTLCYHTEEEEDQQDQCREFALLLSDYMAYLLFLRPEMMLEVAAMGDMRYTATRARVKKILWDRDDDEDDEHRDVKLVCRGLLRESSVPDEGYSVLSGSCRLARELKQLKERQVIEMWKVITKVWVEMLSYAAARCSPSAHVAELANGGELLTLVWLLKEHLG